MHVLLADLERMTTNTLILLAITAIWCDAMVGGKVVHDREVRGQNLWILAEI